MTYSKEQKIQVVYYALKNRLINPEGTFDKQGRWYPSDGEDCGVSKTHRSPSRAYPYSYMTACRTKKHVEALSDELLDKKFNSLNPESILQAIESEASARKIARAAKTAVKTEGLTHYYDRSTGQVLAY